MVTSKRGFNAFERAREFANTKSTAGYNTGADRLVEGEITSWVIYWGVGFLDPGNTVSR